jgi:hypothetical protein
MRSDLFRRVPTLYNWRVAPLNNLRIDYIILTLSNFWKFSRSFFVCRRFADLITLCTIATSITLQNSPRKKAGPSSARLLGLSGSVGDSYCGRCGNVIVKGPIIKSHSNKEMFLSTELWQGLACSGRCPTELWRLPESWGGRLKNLSSKPIFSDLHDLPLCIISCFWGSTFSELYRAL